MVIRYRCEQNFRVGKVFDVFFYSGDGVGWCFYKIIICNWYVALCIGYARGDGILYRFFLRVAYRVVGVQSWCVV